MKNESFCLKKKMFPSQDVYIFVFLINPPTSKSVLHHRYYCTLEVTILIVSLEVIVLIVSYGNLWQTFPSCF